MSNIFIYSGCKDTPPEAPGAKVTNLDDGTGNIIFITDETGKMWEVTHAVINYGIQPDQFQYGLRPFAIKPITKTKFLFPRDDNYPPKEDKQSIFAFHLNGLSRAYALYIMNRFEDANDF